ncbi:hypothetical protein K523DRAFT_318073 [Schizophyllum commune Tattone D]|nr:hypothetical protein K523DRAFT_318073 [Schizophyllum commune Tattone D]
MSLTYGNLHISGRTPLVRLPHRTPREALALSRPSWLLYLGPRLLARHFRDEKYYKHFVELSRLVHKCLQFEISMADVADIRSGFAKWVQDFEKLYYQNNPERVQVCTLNVHALLHIADGIVAMGPVWTYWAFPMERYCGRLQRVIRSRRYPWSNLDAHILATAQLAQLRVRFGLEHELSLKPSISKTNDGSYSHKDYPSCTLLPRSRPSSSIKTDVFSRIKSHLATRYNINIQLVNQHFRPEYVQQWSAVRRLQGGDDMFAADMMRRSEDYRDRTFVKYVPLVDSLAHYRSRQSQFRQEAYYGQLKNILLITLPAAVASRLDEDHRTDEPVVLILASIQPCDTTGSVSRSLPDALCYKNLKPTPVVLDIITVQCLIGRAPLVPEGGGSTERGNTEFCIIDRSMGEVNNPIYDGD